MAIEYLRTSIAAGEANKQTSVLPPKRRGFFGRFIDDVAGALDDLFGEVSDIFDAPDTAPAAQPTVVASAPKKPALKVSAADVKVSQPSPASTIELATSPSVTSSTSDVGQVAVEIRT